MFDYWRTMMSKKQEAAIEAQQYTPRLIAGVGPQARRRSPLIDQLARSV